MRARCFAGFRYRRWTPTTNRRGAGRLTARRPGIVAPGRCPRGPAGRHVAGQVAGSETRWAGSGLPASWTGKRLAGRGRPLPRSGPGSCHWTLERIGPGIASSGVPPPPRSGQPLLSDLQNLQISPSAGISTCCPSGQPLLWYVLIHTFPHKARSTCCPSGQPLLSTAGVPGIETRHGTFHLLPFRPAVVIVVGVAVRPPSAAFHLLPFRPAVVIRLCFGDTVKA